MIFNTGASEVSRAEFEELNKSLTVDTTNLKEDFTLNALLQLLAEQYFANNLIIFDGKFLHDFNYETLITGGIGTILYETYFGIDGQAVSTNGASKVKVTPNVSSEKYKYIKVHVNSASANYGRTYLNLLDASNNVLQSLCIVDKWSSGTSTISDKWYTFDLSAYEVTDFAISVGGYSGYESGQHYMIKIDKICATNDFYYEIETN